jgi:hypothetical protein
MRSAPKRIARRRTTKVSRYVAIAETAKTMP